MKSTLAMLCVAGATLTAAGSWRPADGNVRVTCPMTIGGSFDAKTTALKGSVATSGNGSSTLDGSFAVDLRTLDTGISLRNDHLREKYLEVDKGPGYDQATMSEIELKGLNADAPKGKGTFTGSLTLHGVKKSVSGSVEIRQAGAGLRVTAVFPVKLSDYSISEPSYLGVGIKSPVQVQVAFALTQ